MVSAAAGLRLAVASLLALAAGAGAAGAAPAPLRAPRLARVHSFALALGSGDLSGNLARRYAGYDLVVVDGGEATAAQVATLHRAGTVVLAYLDVGTIEPYRSWYAQAKRYRLDYWPAWGEWYARVSAPGFRRLIAGRVAPALLAKGFDGLFLDNTDMVETHPGERSGMVALVRELAALVHRRHGFLFAQNGDATVAPLLPYLDGWNREDVSWTYDASTHRYVRQSRADTAAALAALRRIRARGLLVTATDYVARGDAAAVAQSRLDACRAGALPFASDIELTRIPAAPLTCP